MNDQQKKPCDVGPICDFVASYLQKGTSRFHMPGHKGHGPLGFEERDITEIKGADVLSCAQGIIAESEENATRLFGTAHSFYSTEGSTLCIKTMLALIASRVPRGKRACILAARNAHKAFLYAAALLDVDVIWLYGKKQAHLCSCDLRAEDVEAALRELPEPPDAVYLTTPDYLGELLDVRGIARVCHENGVRLLVDNAHGAYLKFLEPSRHPIDEGADMCCDSAHKTLPVLTGGAYLHLSKAAAEDLEAVRGRMAIFASTSPSYLILQSLDACNRMLEGDYPTALRQCIQRLENSRRIALQNGIAAETREPLKLVLSPAQKGYTGLELAEYLRDMEIEPEFCDPWFVVLMASPSHNELDFCRLDKALALLPTRKPVTLPIPERGKRMPRTRMTVREAIFSPCETVAIKDAEGRICASPTVSCPPAVPIVVSGEVIDADAVRLLAAYGFDRVEVVRE